LVTLTPTRRPDQVEILDPAELLIREARQKTRRRRGAYAFVSLVVAAALFATMFSSIFNRPAIRTSYGTPATEVPLVVPRCAATQLRVSGIEANGAAVSAGWIVRLRNASAHSCTLSSYPSVRGINQWNGAVLTAAHTRNSYIGGWNSSKPVPTVDLKAKGGVASFLIDFVTNNNYRACPYVIMLRVSIPRSTNIFTLKSRLQVCKYFQVHPFVPGLSGGNL
jgi:hypothetical protein